MVTKIERLTISLPSDLVQLTDAIAREKNTSRSKVVAECLREMVRNRIEADMIEGYKETAKANLEFAEDSVHLVNEILAES
jgi:metal-responsive CopG/Arc/MetJ family transcriptional regulator